MGRYLWLEQNQFIKVFFFYDYLIHIFPFLLFQTVMISGPELEPWQEFDALNYSVPKPEAVQWNK